MLDVVRRRLGGRVADRGAATAGLILLGAFGALALVFLAVLPLLSGTEQSARAQTAADAAALGGAEHLRDHLLRGVVSLRPGDSLLDLLPGTTGDATAAATMAGRNGATLREYDRSGRRVEVRVRLNEPGAAGTSPVEARAVAQLGRNGLNLGACRLAEEDPEPTPTPSPTPEGEEPTPEPAPTLFTFTCAGVLSWQGEDLTDLAGALRDALREPLRPRLVA
ncbi:hypothetical protein [Georgenia thermotolerans]|uniref:Uncharacterized protein n=1 Tax=Georgenia thermotolerans TaxID=527326 RepID=A0A7J5UM23_9MICO|nr:hypothetical protein [Georgenia thermotolerans]KAE8762973.1 hypothetical protein GB883_16615 [Georgenia thermotolerans]